MINKDTKIYGSFSSNPGNNGCIFFNSKFKEYNIDAIYKSFYSTDALLVVMSTRHLNFSGFALSMPLKIEILQYLNNIDNDAKQIGSVNTVLNNDGVLNGYNTDWIGVKNFLINNSKYLESTNDIFIIGDGGFSKAIQYSLNYLDKKFNIITRKNWNSIKNIEKSLIINATPIDIEINDNNLLIDGRPFTNTGKQIAKYQAAEQFKLYTGIKLEI